MTAIPQTRIEEMLQDMEEEQIKIMSEQEKVNAQHLVETKMRDERIALIEEFLHQMNDDLRPPSHQICTEYRIDASLLLPQ